MTNKQLPYIIASVILVFIIGLAVVFGHMPLSSQINAKKQQLSQKSSELALVQKKVKELNQLRSNIQQMEEETTRLQNQIPDTPDVPNVVDLIEKYANESGIIVANMKFNIDKPTGSNNKTAPTSPIKINTCQMDIKGRYSSVIKFLDLLKTSPRLFGIESIQFSPNSEDGQDIKVGLNLAYFNYTVPKATTEKKKG